MILVEGEKYSCLNCIKGHRSSTCSHTDRPLLQVRRRGRPVVGCNHRLAVLPNLNCGCGVTPVLLPHGQRVAGSARRARSLIKDEHGNDVIEIGAHVKQIVDTTNGRVTVLESYQPKSHISYNPLNPSIVPMCSCGHVHSPDGTVVVKPDPDSLNGAIHQSAQRKKSKYDKLKKLRGLKLRGESPNDLSRSSSVSLATKPSSVINSSSPSPSLSPVSVNEGCCSSRPPTPSAGGCCSKKPSTPSIGCCSSRAQPPARECCGSKAVSSGCHNSSKRAVSSGCCNTKPAAPASNCCKTKPKPPADKGCCANSDPEPIPTLPPALYNNPTTYTTTDQTASMPGYGYYYNPIPTYNEPVFYIPPTMSAALNSTTPEIYQAPVNASPQEYLNQIIPVTPTPNTTPTGNSAANPRPSELEFDFDLNLSLDEAMHPTRSYQQIVSGYAADPSLSPHNLGIVRGSDGSGSLHQPPSARTLTPEEFFQVYFAPTCTIPGNCHCDESCTCPGCPTHDTEGNNSYLRQYVDSVPIDVGPAAGPSIVNSSPVVMRDLPAVEIKLEPSVTPDYTVTTGSNLHLEKTQLRQVNVQGSYMTWNGQG